MTTKIGDLGEQLVSQWLQSKSYRILHHSWRCRWGEIDIIAEDNISSTLLFVEVKTRSSNNWDNDGLEAISPTKQEKISNSAALFLAANSQYVNFYMRFDVALVKYKKLPIKQTLDIPAVALETVYRENSCRDFSTVKNGCIFKIVNYLENAFEVS